MVLMCVRMRQPDMHDIVFHRTKKERLNCKARSDDELNDNEKQ